MSLLALRHPRLAWLALALATAFFAVGLPRLQTDVGFRAFLGPRHPAVERLDRFLAHFQSGLTLAAVFSCDESPVCETAIDRPVLDMTRGVADALAASPAVRRVLSPADALLPVSGPGGITPHHRIGLERGAIDAAEPVSTVASDPWFIGQLVSADGRVGAIVAELPDSSSDTAVRAYAALDDALAPFEREGFRFHRVGGPVEFVVAGQELQDATARLIPVMVALVGASLFALFRTLAVVAASLATVGVAVLWTLGTLAWLGWPQNSLTQTLAPLVLVIGVCDGIHLISGYVRHLARPRATSHPERRAALERALRDVATPCLMTSVTTAAGFISFATADLESFARYGIVAAVGVMAALVLSFSLLPLLLLHLSAESIHVPRTTAAWERALGRLALFAEVRWRPILVVSAVLGLAGALGMTSLRVDSSFEELYGKDSQVVRWSHFVRDHLRKPDTLEIDLVLAPGAEWASDKTADAVRRIEADLARIESLDPGRSLFDRSDWPAFAAAASADGDALGEWLSRDRRHVRLSIGAEKLPQDQMRRVMNAVRAALDTGLPVGWSAEATGPFAVTSDMIDAIRTTQLRSFAAAGLAVGILLTIYLGSLRWALLALLPNLLPVVVTVGIMGLVDLPLDIGSAMVAAVVLGIAVDDTIHILDRFGRLRREGIPAARAIGRAVEDVGQPLVSTSLALAAGFAALSVSPWASVASFGIVSSLAILLAMLADLLVLPALVFAVSGAGRAATAGGDNGL